jgi:replicative DNA helicase
MNFLIRASIMPDYDAISIFFSFEMQIEAEMEREIQIYYNCKNHELINNITNNKEQWKQQREHLSSSYAQNLYVSEEPYLTIKEMIDVIKKTEAVSNKKCKLIGIDYIDFIKASTGKEYEAVKENMNAIKSYLARGLNTAVIVLCQTNRMGNLTEFEEVGLRSGKGGSGIEAASDYLIGIWQDENSNIMARFNKHRRIDSRYLGAPNPYMHLKFNPQTFTLDEICFTENPNKKTKEKEEKKSWYDKD